MSACFSSAAVLVLIVVLILVVLIVLIALIILTVLLMILILIVHFEFLRGWHFAASRWISITIDLGFILGFKEDCSQKTREYGCGNPACCSFESSDKDTKKTIAINCFSNTLSQGISKSREGYCCAGTCEISKWLINTDCTKKDTNNNIAYQDSCRCQFGFID